MSARLDRYQRQTVLPEFGIAGQNALLAAKVVVVGAGGLGCAALQYLAAAGVGRVTVVDGDIIERSNLQRQALYLDADVGQSKAEVIARRLAAQNPEVYVIAKPVRLEPKNAQGLLADCDLILDGSDNFPTKYLINDVAVRLGIPFVGASVLGFSGQLSVYNYQSGPTYRCLFPEAARAIDLPNCATNGVIGALPGILGCMQALEAIKLLAGVGDLLVGRLLIIDGLSFCVRELSFERQESARAAALECPQSDLTTKEKCIMIKEITVTELKERLDKKEEFQLIDVREDEERLAAHIGGDHHPLATLLSKLDQISRDKPVVIYCRSGGRSGHACQELAAKHGFVNLINLRGGLLEWRRVIDTSLAVI